MDSHRWPASANTETQQTITVLSLGLPEFVVELTEPSYEQEEGFKSLLVREGWQAERTGQAGKCVSLSINMLLVPLR
jgi:hypothetical protein